MNELDSNFQICYFADLSKVEPTADIIASLAREFSDRGLIPTTYQEIGPGGMLMRIRLLTAANEWVVDLDSGRIDLQKGATSTTGENLGTLEEFSLDGCDIVSRILKLFPAKGKRLSLVTHALLWDIPPQTLEKMYFRLFNPLPFYEESHPTAWASRTVTRLPVKIGEADELTNVILSTSREERRFLIDPSKPSVDSLEVQVDINTYQKNTDTRFTIDSLKEFLTRAIELRSRVLEQFRGCLHG